VTQLQLLAGWAKREHTFFTSRDSSGANGRITALWQPLGKVHLTAMAWREFRAVESDLVNNSLNKGASLSGTWDVTAKIRADAQYRHEKRDFSEATGIVLPGGANDTTRYAGAGLTYLPQSFLQLNASLYHEKRTGSPLVGTGSYKANGASLSLTAQF
jgi:hypothetical protein